MRRIAVVILIMIQLLSCVPTESDQGPPPSPTIERTDTPTDPREEKMGGAVIIYQRSGGFAGISEAWTFYADGRIISIDETEYNLEAEQVSRLLTEIEALGFFEMSGSGKLFSDCRDCFSHQLTAKGGGKFNSISAVDGAPGTQDQFWKILEKINEILHTLME